MLRDISHKSGRRPPPRVSNMSTYDFLVIGGGALGMLTARELAASGASIAMLDRGECAKEASWSGGGILSPLYPWRYSDPVTALCNWSQAHYIALTDKLKEESGIDPELSKTGLLMLHAEDEARALDWAQTHRHWMDSVDQQFIYEKEPNLGPGFERGLWMPHVCSVRNPRLGRAIKTSLLRLPNLTIFEHHNVTGIKKNSDSFSVVTEQDTFNANKVIIAAGAWTNEVLQLLGYSLPIQPVRGQMLLFHPQKTVLKRIVLTEGKYAIPRKDGRVVVGSTLEHVGFDKSTTDDAKQQLSELAFRLVPALRDAELEKQWAGLRPGSPDGVPYIGELDALPGLFINAGHFRNGLVLAPASARLMADIVLARQPIVDPAPYKWVWKGLE